MWTNVKMVIGEKVELLGIYGDDRRKSLPLDEFLIWRRRVAADKLRKEKDRLPNLIRIIARGVI